MALRIVSYFGPAALHQPLALAAYLFAVLIGLYFMAGAFLFRSRAQPYDPRLASAMLRMDAEAILQRYKELNFDHRENARLPLNHCSWPDYGDQWSYVQVSLCTHARMVTILILKVQVLWSQMGYKNDLKLFALSDRSLLYQVIEALEELQQRTHALHREA